MHRIKAIVPILLLALGVVTSPAHAKGKFLTLEAYVTDGNVRELGVQGTFHGGLLVSFREVGLGGNASTLYQVTANATATYACINNGDNHPQATNKAGVAGPVSGGGTFTADKGGNIVGAIAVAPLGPGDFICPTGQSIVLAEVSYTNVVITDLTNNVSESIPGTFSMILVPTN
jgi:hypothetical protein